MVKSGKDLQDLWDIVDLLLTETPLPEKCRDHALTGNLYGFRECHIHPDWLLIYLVQHDRLVLTTIRTGTHSDLF
jgi:mRNA interferase YafQ